MHLFRRKVLNPRREVAQTPQKPPDDRQGSDVRRRPPGMYLLANHLGKGPHDPFPAREEPERASPQPQTSQPRLFGDDTHVIDDLVVLFGGDAQAREHLLPRRAAIVSHLAACEDCQIEMATLLEASSRAATIGDEQRTQLKTLYNRTARAMYGPHLDEARPLYERYVAEWIEHGQRPEPSAGDPELSPVLRHLARHPQCDEAVRAMFSERLVARLAAEMTDAPDPAAVASAGTTTRESEFSPARQWRVLAREQNPVAIEVGMQLTDFEEYDIEVEHFTEGALTLVVWGPDRLHHNRQRTLKLLRPEHHDDPALREAFVAAAIEWCHVVPHGQSHAAPQLVRIPIFDDAPAVLVSYAPHTLRTMLDGAQRTHRPLTLAQAFGWSQEIAEALAALHRQKRPDGVTPYFHGDLKPENILIGDEATAWLSDIGMEQVWVHVNGSLSPHIHPVEKPDGTRGNVRALPAAGAEVDGEASLLQIDPRAGSRGRIVGTARYMSPERWLGADENGPKSDVYALGIVLHELFAGAPGGAFMPHPHSDAGWFRMHSTGRTVALRNDSASEALTRGPLAELASKGGAQRQTAERMLDDLDILVHRCLSTIPEHRPTAAEVYGQLTELAGRVGLERAPDPSGQPQAAYAADPGHLRRLAHSYARVGQQDTQLDLLLVAARHAPSPDLWVGLGSALHDQGYHHLALQAYKAAESLHAIHDEAERAIPHLLAFHRANAYSALGQHDAAIEEYRKTLEHQREHVPALWAASDAHHQIAAAASGPDVRRAHLHQAHAHAESAARQARGTPDSKVIDLRQRIRRAHAEATGEHAHDTRDHHDNH